jgi:hypothetical protein
MKTIDTLIVYYYDGLYYYSGNGIEIKMYDQDFYLYSDLLQMGLLLTGIFLCLLVVPGLKEKMPDRKSSSDDIIL